jgi:hypothetical protein
MLEPIVVSRKEKIQFSTQMFTVVNTPDMVLDIGTSTYKAVAAIVVDTGGNYRLTLYANTDGTYIITIYDEDEKCCVPIGTPRKDSLTCASLKAALEAFSRCFEYPIKDEQKTQAIGYFWEYVESFEQRLSENIEGAQVLTNSKMCPIRSTYSQVVTCDKDCAWLMHATNGNDNTSISWCAVPSLVASVEALRIAASELSDVVDAHVRLI